MAKILRCRDLGFDCDAVVRADSDEEVLQQAATHAREAHGLEEVPDELAQKVLASIQDERSSSTGM
jgi:predicted small metal-binding protein